MKVDAEEEARADAELAASHAANPMMDGVETSGSSSGGTIRFRKTVSIQPRCNPTDRSVIVAVGDRSWREVGWSGVGHRTPVNSALGAFCRFYYPGMVTLPNGDRVAAHKWSHWGLKEHVEGQAQDVGGGTCVGAVWKGFWERYRLEGEGDYEKEKRAKRVFQKAATKVVRDSFSNARIQAIVNFHKRVKNINIKKTPDVKKMHLEAAELVQGEVDWIMKDPDAWRWICEYWAGGDFQGASDRNRGNRTSKPGMQRRLNLASVQALWKSLFGGHQGPDPENPEVLCDEQVTERLAKYKEQVIQRHG
ncbi:hypothetical protein U9M48_039849 [Paspalum notatum var. saurae]|uniref:Uncharacterized protein n=1 Tax=Paspalum notatum var. saurae TaxID=547442 RepID=A0AAQ3XCJ8_PASNO